MQYGRNFSLVKIEKSLKSSVVLTFRNDKKMPFRFPVKFDIPQHVYVNARVLRDHFKRLQYAEYEVTRNALKYIANNTELPPRARLEAQLQLTSMPKYTSYNQIRDRCVASGNSKSLIRDFKLNRTVFRERARAGLIPGVSKASW